MALRARRRSDRARQLRRDRAPCGGCSATGARAAAGEQQVLVRVTPDVRGETHEKISTGQADSKFGFSIAQADEAFARVQRDRRAVAAGRARAHRLAAARAGPVSRRGRRAGQARRLPRVGPRRRSRRALHAPSSRRRRRSRSTSARSCRRAHAHAGGAGRRLLIEPGRALSANAGVTLYTVQSVKQNVSRWVAVDGGMSDNLRPMLYGAPYEAHVADRFDGRDARAGWPASTASPAT